MSNKVVYAFIAYSMLQVVLFALKICNWISLSWFWIFMPLWLPYFALLCMVVFIGLYIVIEEYRDERRAKKWKTIS